MIKFFRKIRYDLMGQNKMGKYFKYAIGEIVLVVIGILIALQINNWNEERAESQLERDFLQKINLEFKNNKEQFQMVLNRHKKAYKSCNWILENHAKSNLNKDSLLKHLNEFRYSFTFNPSKSSINAIINSGNLSIIRNNELANKLVEWSDLVEDYMEEEVVSRNFYLDVITPFQIKHFVLYNPNEARHFENYFDFNEETKSEFLNIIATKRRMIRQIVENREREYQKVMEAMNIIIKASSENN